MFKPQEGIGHCGQNVPGPPWLLGERGVAIEAPENTLTSLRCAVERGLDGFAYEVRACASGDLVLLADETLDRTTDSSGALRVRTLPELFGIDAGGWFSRAHLGEPLALFDEALVIEGRPGERPQHWVILPEPGLIAEVTRVLTGMGRRHSVRVASKSREACRDLRSAGFEAAWIQRRAGEEERRFVRDERLDAFAAPGASWLRDGALAREWRAERWALGVDDPDELLALCRAPLNGLITSEARRALATRALVFLSPEDTGTYPLQVEPLRVESSSSLDGVAGEWCGHWDVRARIRNPMPFRVRGGLEVEVRRGAFETHGLPAAVELDPGQSTEVVFRLSGGSWSPGGDPLFVAHLFWERGPGRPAERLTLDTPLVRVRELVLRERTTRLPLLRERPGDPPLSVTVVRRGPSILVGLENPGPFQDASTVVHLDGQTVHAGRGVRLPLPADWRQRAGGLPFSVAVAGKIGGRLQYRRWAGGLPNRLEAGAPGRIFPDD